MFHSTQNAGDLALLEISIHQLGKYFRTTKFTISANYPEESWYKEKGYKVVPSPISLIGKSKNLSPWLQVVNFLLSLFFTILYFMKLRLLIPKDWNSLFIEYESSDLVVAVPGNQIYSTGRFGWPFPANIFSFVLAHLFGKPVYILPQSIGPFRRWWEKRVFQWAYSKARLIYLRDKTSLRLGRTLGLPSNKTIYAPDPAFSLQPESKEIAQSLLKSFGWFPEKNSIGITMIAPMGRSLNYQLVQNYYQVLEQTIPQFALLHQLQVVIFYQVTGPTHLEDDRIPSRLFFKKVQEIYKDILIIEKSLSPSMLKACYGEMDVFLASRLHSGIFALGMEVPTIFIGYLPKSFGILESIGFENCVLELSGLTHDKLLSVLECTWENRKKISSELEKVICSISKQSDIPFYGIYSDVR